ncbi:MAG: hypothetical protein F6K42_20105, partial [Leptolyngbya sp. SIO1D8]|nr:hypothetical protein [Leptolyngbya sp. SIO1D8]
RTKKLWSSISNGLGTSEQRMEWFSQGINTGDINQCNTFDMATP